MLRPARVTEGDSIEWESEEAREVMGIGDVQFERETAIRDKKVTQVDVVAGVVRDRQHP